jgi:4-hydroxy-2-oxoheptanedioate aldolase
VVAGIHNGRPDVALARIAKGFQLRHRQLRRALMAEGSQQIMAAMRAGRSASQAKPSSGY